MLVEDEAALAHLLDHRVLSEEFEVQQALAALPDLEGVLRGPRITLEAEVPAGSPNISAGTWARSSRNGSGSPSESCLAPITASAGASGRRSARMDCCRGK